MFTHSECEISQSWRTQFSSHGAFNLNGADMPPPLPLHHILIFLVYTSHPYLPCLYITSLSSLSIHHILIFLVYTSHPYLPCLYITSLSSLSIHHILIFLVYTSHPYLPCLYITSLFQIQPFE